MSISNFNNTIEADGRGREGDENELTYDKLSEDAFRKVHRFNDFNVKYHRGLVGKFL